MYVGRYKRLFYCLCGGGETRAPSSSSSGSLFGDEAPPSRLRGCGQREEVELRGGVWRLRREKASSCVEASKNERETKVRKDFVWKTVGFSRRARSGFEARETKAL